MENRLPIKDGNTNCGGMSLRRLDQILANFGYGSRKEVKRLILAGQVSVRRQIINDPKIKAEPGEVELDGAPIEHPNGLVLLLHKPAGYVCSHDLREGPRIYDLLPQRWMQRNPMPTSIGRLDKDTTGALLITDQMDLVHRLTSPKHKEPKVYLATLERPPEESWIAELASGDFRLENEDKPCAPAQLEILSENQIRLTMTEGRYHQVKRIFAQLGSPVVRLHRESFAGFGADHLAPGTWEIITLPEEKQG